jgi:hypothetical protein
MEIQLKPEEEYVVVQAIQAGLIAGADEVVHLGVETIRMRLIGRCEPTSAASQDEWERAFHTWVQGHSSTSPVLSEEAMGRDSIYGVNGE